MKVLTVIALAAAAITPNVVAFTTTTSSSSSRFAISQNHNAFSQSNYRASSSLKRRHEQRRSTTHLEMISMPSLFSKNKKEKCNALFVVRAASNAVAKRCNILYQKVKRSFTILFTSAFLLFSSAKLYTPPTHASSSSSAATTTASRVVVSSPTTKTIQLVSSTNTATATATTTGTLDKMVDKYIQKHMFDNDQYNAFESTYREAHADTTGSSAYPTALSNVASSVVGKRDLRSTLSSTTKQVSEENTDVAAKVMKGMIQFLVSTSKMLETKLKLAPNVAYGVTLFSCIIVAPAMVFLFGMGFSNKQRLKMDELETERYGEVLGMYADRKKDVDIELDDDDEDDDDDDYDDDDDDDDDE